MGVINLGVLVEKLKKKMSGSFVTKTDYASSSAGGVIKTDSTYATDITDAGKLKSKTITAANYDSANAAAFISKGTLDALIAAGMLGGGGMTWTKIYDGTTTQGGTMPFVEGTDAFDHKLMIIEMLSGTDGAGFAFVGLEVLTSETTSVKVSLQRYDDAPVLTITKTNFSQPNNMGASRAIIYVLD